MSNEQTGKPNPIPSSVGERLRDALQLIQVQFEETRKLLQDVPQRMHMGMVLLAESAEKLGHMGWTIPMWATPREIHDLLESVEDEQELDDYFLEYYDIETLKSDLLGSQLLTQWKPLLEECLEAYVSGLYKICIPSLVTVIEGAAARLGGQFERTADVERIAREMVREYEKGSLSRAIWISIHSFLTELFQYVSFSSEAPRLNRHWILHGRSPAEWTKADALRLFHCLHVLAEMSVKAPGDLPK